MELLHFASVGDAKSMEALAEEHAVAVSTQYTPMCTFHVMHRAPSGRKALPFQAATGHPGNELVSCSPASCQFSQAWPCLPTRCECRDFVFLSGFRPNVLRL